jgi:hypothetical protein
MDDESRIDEKFESLRASEAFGVRYRSTMHRGNAFPENAKGCVLPLYGHARYSMCDDLWNREGELRDLRNEGGLFRLRRRVIKVSG